MESQQAFHRAIVAAPDDDAPGLIFADWLEEHGDPDRAELIRAQCQLTTWEADDPRRVGAAWREAELLAHHERRWRGRLLTLPQLVWGSFERGFVRSVTIHLPRKVDWSGGDGGDLARDVIASAPVHQLTLRGLTLANARALAKTPLSERIRSLDLSAEPLDAVLALLSAASWPALESLVIDWVKCAGVGMTALLEALRRLPKLERLRVRGADWSPREVALLAEWDGAEKLKALDLSENGRIGDRGARLVGESRGLRGLRELHLGEIGLGVSGLVGLTKSSALADLEALWLGGNTLGDEGVGLLAGSDLWPRLRQLDLRNTGIGDVGAAALGGWWARPNLQRVSLRNNLIGPAGLKSWRGGTSAGRGSPLRVDLGYNRIGDEGAALLANLGWFGRVRGLDLYRNQVGPLGAAALAQNLGEVRALDLSFNQLSDAGTRALVKGRPASLRSLKLSCNGLGDAGARTLARSNLFAKLFTLDLDFNAIRDGGAEALADGRTPVDLFRLDLFKNQIERAGLRALLRSERFRSQARLELGGNPGHGGAAVSSPLPEVRKVIRPPDADD